MAKKTGARGARKPKKGRGRDARPLPKPPAKSGRERALGDVAGVLAKLGRPAAIIGGIAVIAWGHERHTADIDCAIAAPLEDLREIFDAFSAAGLVGREPGTFAFAQENFVLLLRHKTTGTNVDVSLAQLQFELEALSRTVVLSYGRAKIPVPSLTDLLIYKLVAGRPKDLEDARALLALDEDDAIDDARVRDTLCAFDELLDTDRAGEWARLRAWVSLSPRGGKGRGEG